MSEKDIKPEKKPTVKRWPFVLGTILALLGIGVPIAWDWWSDKLSLSLQELSATPLVNTEQAPEDLRIIYKDAEVGNLSNVTFRLQNTGRIPIRPSEVVEFPKIVFGPLRIFDVRILERFPKELAVTVNKEEDGAEGNRVRVLFPLLNAGEWVSFSVLTNASQSTDLGDASSYTASARITGMAGLEVSRAQTRKFIAVSNLPWTVYVVAFFTLGAIRLALYLWQVKGLHKEYAKNWKSGKFGLPPSGTPDVLRAYLTVLSAPIEITSKEMETALVPLKDLDPKQSVPPEVATDLAKRVEALLQEYAFYWIAISFFLGSALVGTAYIFNAISV